MMSRNTCRVCNGPFYAEPVLQFSNMPKAAQHLPSIADLPTEQGVDLEVCQCKRCGLVQLSNHPVPYYREVIRASAFSGEMERFRREQFEDFVAKYSLHNKKVIEIGTGKGEYLSLMKDCGVDAYGIEYAQDSVDVCRTTDLNVSKDYITHLGYRLPNAPFNAFFILNFFEHIPDPNATLGALYHNTTDDAIGLIEVPNFDMILKNNLFTEFIGDHLFYFTKDTLRATLERNGYEIIECKNIWYDYITSATVRKRQKVDVSNFATQRRRLHKEIHTYVDSFEKVAVWGAGHQALAVLSLLELGDKIQYVVDDATFKQDKYTPATHLPIVSSNELDISPVDAIIVMAASYSDEIVKKLKVTPQGETDIAVLRDYGLEIAFSARG